MWPDTPAIRDRITQLQKSYRFFTNTGNWGREDSGIDFSNHMPHLMPGVVVVGSLNKSKGYASHNTAGEPDFLAPGTNIFINGEMRSGSEIALAIWVALYSYTLSDDATVEAITDQFYRLITYRFECHRQEYNYLEYERIPLVDYVNQSIPNLNFPGIHKYPSQIACDITNHERDLRQALRQNKRIILNAYPEGLHLVKKFEQFLFKIFREERRDIHRDLLLITGSCDQKQIRESVLRDNYVWGPFISNWVTNFADRSVDQLLTHDVTDKTHTFLSFNRVVRPHRIILVSELISRGLMDTNFVSFNGRQAHGGLHTHDCTGREVMSLEEADHHKRVVGDRDYYIDNINFSENQATTDSPLQFYQNSFFSLVTETFFFENDLFPSEKIYKAIAHRHPFILVGSAGMLQLLRDQGFRTYGEWFDESYDEIIDPHVRMQAILNEVQRVDSLSWNHKCEMFEAMRETAEHNRSHLLNNNFIRQNSNIEKLSDWLQAEFYYETSHTDPQSFIDIASVDTSQTVIESGYGDDVEHRVCHSIQQNTDRRVVLDFTREYFHTPLFDIMSTLPDLSNVLLCAEPTDLTPTVAQRKCTNLGLTINYEHHFVNNIHSYMPDLNQMDENVPHAMFTMFTGKTKPERTALVGLLSYYDVLHHGHVSYFGDNVEYSFEKIQDFYRSDAPNALKEMVQAGLEKIQLPLVLDTPQLTQKISHSQRFNPTYYEKCDFVVTLETEFSTQGRVPLVTEKSLKPLIMNKPQMILGLPNQTRQLCAAVELNTSWYSGNWRDTIDWIDWQQWDSQTDNWTRFQIFFDMLLAEIQRRE